MLVLGKNNDQILTERNRWLRQFQQQHLFPNQDIEDAINEPLDAQRHAQRCCTAEQRCCPPGIIKPARRECHGQGLHGRNGIAFAVQP